jgi:parvulin-like peptidyl-prolyl isomerase
MPIPKDERFQQLMGLKEEVLDATVEREVLAHAAGELGLAATTQDAEDLVMKGQVIVLGDAYDWLGDLPFNYDIFKKSFLRSLQASEANYLETQRRELLARTVRDLLESSVAVSEGEVRELYQSRANKLSLRYARYESAEFADLVDPSQAEIEAWVADHREELEQQFATQGSRFTKLPKQARLWVIEQPKSTDAEALQAARKNLADARKRIQGGTDFRTVAREVSSHDTARSGGAYGWVSEDSASGLDPVVDEASSQLEVGELSEVLEGESSLYLVRVTGRREGDVPVEEALPELATEAVKQDKALATAKRAAERDLAAIKAGKPLTEVFALPGGGIEDLGVDGEAARGDPTRPGKAELRETGLFSKDDAVPGLGPMPDLVDAAWASDPDAPLLDQVFESGEAFVVAGLEEKEEASDEGFTEARAELYTALAKRKGQQVTSHFAERHCLEAKARGDIVPTPERIERVVVYDVTTEDGKQPPEMQPYRVCDRVGNRGGFLRSGLAAQAAGGNAG